MTENRVRCSLANPKTIYLDKSLFNGFSLVQHMQYFKN